MKKHFLVWLMLLLTLNFLSLPAFAINSMPTSTPVSPTVRSPGVQPYMFLIYLNTSGWSCNNCNGEQNSALIPVPPATYPLPAGKYSAFMSVAISTLDTNGRWLKVNNIRVMDNAASNATIVQSGGLGQISCDGCWPWSTNYTYTATYTSKSSIKPYFALDVQDSSHNETYWLMTGVVTFTPTS